MKCVYVFAAVIGAGLPGWVGGSCGAVSAAVATIDTGPDTQMAVRIEDAWIRTPAPSSGVTGGYLTIVNDGSAPVRLIEASSPLAKTVELHEMTMDGDVMRMRPVKEIVVPARGRATLRPGGLHLMLFGVPAPLTSGTLVPLTLQFEDGRSVAAEAVVRLSEAAH